MLGCLCSYEGMVVTFLWLLLTLQMVATLIKAFPRLADASYLDLFICHESHNSNEGRHLWVGFWKLPLPHHAITDWWESQISQSRIFCFYSIIENIFVHPQMKFSIQTKGRLCIYNVSKCPVTMNSIFKDTLSSGKHARRSLKWEPNMTTSSPNSTEVLVSLYSTVYIQTLFENVYLAILKKASLFAIRMSYLIKCLLTQPIFRERWELCGSVADFQSSHKGGSEHGL